MSPFKYLSRHQKNVFAFLLMTAIFSAIFMVLAHLLSQGQQQSTMVEDIIVEPMDLREAVDLQKEIQGVFEENEGSPT